MGQVVLDISKKHSSGFSLVEVLLALGLVIMLSIVSYGPLVEYSKQQHFNAFVAEAKNNVNHAYWKNRIDQSGFENFSLGNGYSYDNPTNTVGGMKKLEATIPNDGSDRTVLGVNIAATTIDGVTTTKATFYPNSNSSLPTAYLLVPMIYY